MRTHLNNLKTHETSQDGNITVTGWATRKQSTNGSRWEIIIQGRSKDEEHVLDYATNLQYGRRSGASLDELDQVATKLNLLVVNFLNAIA